MGQKVNPVGLRIGINKDWESKWYAPTKDFAKYLNADLKIRKYLDKELKGCSVASIIIERNNKRTNVTINTSKPGVVIGKGGADIERHKKALQKLTGEETEWITASPKITDIFSDEISACFGGKRQVGEAAKMIENRLNLYLKESRE